jgi:hypothetical protein
VSFDKDGRAWLIDPRSGVAKPVKYPGETAPPTFNPPNAPRGEKEITNEEVKRQAMKMEANMRSRGIAPQIIRKRINEFKESNSAMPSRRAKAQGEAAVTPPAPAPTAAPKQYKTVDEVAKAKASGELSYQEAAKILAEQFGLK